MQWRRKMISETQAAKRELGELVPVTRTGEYYRDLKEPEEGDAKIRSRRRTERSLLASSLLCGRQLSGARM